MSVGKRNRSVGHSTERYVAQKMREIGFPHVVTSRSANRHRDNQKIDLCNSDELKQGRLPYDIQCKNSVKQIKYPLVLSEIEKTEGITPVIIHRQTRKVGTRFMTENDYAILYLEDFFKLIKKVREYEVQNNLVK